MDGKLGTGGMEHLGELAWRPSARLLSVGDDHDHAGLVLIVEDIGRLLDG
jgi:hypothetical protein